MTKFTTKLALAAATALTLTGAAAQAQQTVEVVTGVGYGMSQPEAFNNAIFAWLTEATQLYGPSDFGTAATSGTNCFEIASNAADGVTTQGVEVIGFDPNATWSCSVSGIPTSAFQ